MVPSPLASPEDLTLPRPGSTTARTVLSHALARLSTELAAVPRRLSDARLGASLDGLLRRVRREAPGALLSALRGPATGALVRCARGASSTRSAEEILLQLAFELAVRGALPEPVELPARARWLLSLHARAAVELPHAGRRVRIDPARPLAVEGRPLDGAYVALGDAQVLALVDNNPLAMAEAHPDKRGNAVDLGGKPVSAWVSALAEARAIVDRHLPEIGPELDLFVQQIVPVGYDDARHLSASYMEAIGTIYLSLHPIPMTMAEALIHEFSHTKVNALFELDPLLVNAWEPLYASPVRPDPRPLHGVLLAVHAFLPVERLYANMLASGEHDARRPDLERRHDEVRRLNREGANVLLAHAVPTEMGRGLLREIAALVED
jgi:HEXXH motif-containing protein